MSKTHEDFIIFLGEQDIEGLQYYKGVVEGLLVKAVRELKKLEARK